MTYDPWHTINDAYRGKDMEAYYKLDACQHPEQKPKWSIGAPLAVSQSAAYQRLVGQVIAAQIERDKWGDTAKILSSAAAALRDAASPDAILQLTREQNELLLAAARRLGPPIGKAIGKRDEAEHKVAGLNEALRQMEVEYREKARVQA